MIDADELFQNMESAEWYNNADRDEVAEELVMNAPTVEERKTGHWIPVTNGRGGHECDQCHSYAPAWQTGEERLTDYCPSCGSIMKEVEHD